MDFNQWNTLWSLSFGIMAVIVTFANLITIRIFLKRKLRKRPHFLLIGLATADLFVGLLSVPLYMAIYLHTQKILTLLYQCADILTGLTSVFTLAMISLERTYSIVSPLHHRKLSSRLYLCLTIVPWALAMSGTILRVLLHYYLVTKRDFVIIINVSLVSPLVLACAGYYITWKKRSSRLAVPSPLQTARDTKLAMTLLIITGAFIGTWLPFQIINIVMYFCISCQSWPLAAIHVMKLLQFSNSFINVVIYPLRIAKFREVIIDFLQNCTRSQSTNSQRRRFLKDSAVDSRQTRKL